jgi:hypothetical protein
MRKGKGRGQADELRHCGKIGGMPSPCEIQYTLILAKCVCVIICRSPFYRATRSTSNVMYIKRLRILKAQPVMDKNIQNLWTYPDALTLPSFLGYEEVHRITW